MSHYFKILITKGKLIMNSKKIVDQVQVKFLKKMEKVRLVEVACSEVRDQDQDVLVIAEDQDIVVKNLVLLQIMVHKMTMIIIKKSIHMIKFSLKKLMLL